MRQDRLFSNISSELKLPQGKMRCAALNLSAGLERREWPLEKNVQFLKQCLEKFQDKIDVWVVLTDPGNPEKAGRLVEKVDNLIRTNVGEVGNLPPQSRVIALPAQPDIRVIMEFLPYLRILITPDTSIAHAASAMGTPVLVLTIGENVTIWDPIGVRHKIVFSDDPFSLETLPVDKVIQGFKQLLDEI